MKYETDRLIIKLSELKDAEKIQEFLGDSETMTYFVEGTYSLNKVKEFIQNDYKDKKHYSVFLKDTNELIGKLSFHDWFMKDTYEIGWIFNKYFTGKGYCTEAAKKMLDVGFNNLNLHRIVATCQPENIPSNRVCRKIGMRLEGTFKKCIHVKDNVWWDENFYAILKEEYKG